LYDVANVAGVAADLSHICSGTRVTGFGKDDLDAALAGCDLVVIPAGVPRKPGMTRDDLFNINAGIVATLADGVAKNCPNAVVNIISNPVNATVPIFAEVMKKHGCYDPRKILGVTQLDVVRSKEFIGALKGVEPSSVSIPVIGGHAGETILPLLSRVSPAHITFTDEELKKLTPRIQNAGTEVVEAKAGAGSATLSMAYAAADFATSCLRGLAGENVVECCYCENSVTEIRFFATLCNLGPNGVATAHPLPSMSEFEKAGLQKAIAGLKGSIAKGVKFVAERK
jgi:malate dehydrogenase